MQIYFTNTFINKIYFGKSFVYSSSSFQICEITFIIFTTPFQSVKIRQSFKIDRIELKDFLSEFFKAKSTMKYGKFCICNYRNSLFFRSMHSHKLGQKSSAVMFFNAIMVYAPKQEKTSKKLRAKILRCCKLFQSSSSRLQSFEIFFVNETFELKSGGALFTFKSGGKKKKVAES